MNLKLVIKLGTYALFIVFAIYIVFMVIAWQRGSFQSVESLQCYMSTFGPLAPVALSAFQAAQVVLPVLPGFFGYAVGSVMFGWFIGFICNYIGISAGSIIAFLLARKFGVKLVKELFKGEKYTKWSQRAATSKSYAAFLFVATLLPLFPDDFLCYLSGLSEMTTKKFVIIIILGKPWCILAYSLGFSLIV